MRATNGVLTSLAILLGSVVIILPEPALATDNPSTADVFAGDSYTRATGTAGGILHFRLGLVADATTANGVQRAGWDNNPGTLFTLTFNTWATGVSPPVVPDGDGTDTCVGEILRDNGATVEATLFTGATCPANASTHTVTLNNAGTYRIRVRVVQTNELVDNYNVNSDNGGTSDKGALRIKLAVSAIAHNGYPSGSTHAYTVAGETVGATTTHTTISAGQSTTNVQVKIIDSGSTQVKANTVAFSSTSTATTFTVDDTFAAASGSHGIELQITATSTLTGTQWTSIGTVTAPAASVSEFVARRSTFVTIDPRITATHLLLVNDATFATPPMSEDAGMTRYNDQIGRLATRYTNSRSEGLVGASFLFSQSIADNGAVLTPDTITSQTVATQGGEAGWGPLQLWNHGAPTGGWTKTVDVTGPAAIDNNAHLLSATAAYTLSVPGGGGEGGTGDPLIVELGSLVADRGDTILIGIGESFLDGTARTGNAAGTFVYIYNPDEVLVVNGDNPTEVQYGTYRYEYTLNSTAPYGNWLVLVRTTDPDTSDPIGANNVFNVTMVSATLNGEDIETIITETHEENQMKFITMTTEESWTFLLFLGILVFSLARGPNHQALLFPAIAATAGMIGIWLIGEDFTLLAFGLILLGFWLESMNANQWFKKTGA